MNLKFSWKIIIKFIFDCLFCWFLFDFCSINQKNIQNLKSLGNKISGPYQVLGSNKSNELILMKYLIVQETKCLCILFSEKTHSNLNPQCSKVISHKLDCSISLQMPKCQSFMKIFYTKKLQEGSKPPIGYLIHLFHLYLEFRWLFCIA